MRIIAELGINTNGDLDTAKRMVEAAAEAGVDGIKVQAYETADFLPVNHPDWALFEENRLNWDEISEVSNLAWALGLEFGGTPTSQAGIAFLADLKVEFLKNGSDFLLRHDLIQAMLDTGISTWVSIGMADEHEVRAVPIGANIMACTSVYPCPDEEANLARLRRRSEIRGYSDHTVGTTAAVMATALGADLFEFHFTLSHDMEGPDHSFSRTPSEAEELVREVRRAEAMLGGEFGPTPGELVNRDAWRVTEGTLRG